MEHHCRNCDDFPEPDMVLDKNIGYITVDVTPFMKQVIGGTLEDFTADLKSVEEKVYALYDALEKFNEKYKIKLELSMEMDVKGIQEGS